MCNIRKDLRDRARMMKGLANALGYDAEYVYLDIENFDLICLGESMREAAETLQKLTDNLKEIEYLVHLIQKGQTRGL